MRSTIVGLLVLLGSIAAPAGASALGDEVDVLAPGMSSAYERITLSELGYSETKSYMVNGTRQTITGYSLRRILNDAAQKNSALSLAKIDSVDIGKPASGSFSIDEADYDFGPPLFYEEGGKAKFVYPGKNGSGAVIATYAKIPAIRLVEDKTSVTIAANPTTSKAGESVNFVAQATGQANGEDVTYTWTFGDGTGQTTSSRHTFAKGGSYKVKVAASGDVGFSASTSITYVVDPKKSNENRKGGGDKKNGSENGDYDGTGTGGYNGGGYGGSGYPGGTGGGTGAPQAPSSPPAPKPKDKPVVPVDDGLVEVTGELVSSSAPVDVVAQAPGGAAEALQEGTPETPGTGIADWVWVTLGLLALMGLGLIAERRGSKLY